MKERQHKKLIGQLTKNRRCAQPGKGRNFPQTLMKKLLRRVQERGGRNMDKVRNP